jgi:hypothetical protein
VSGLSNSRRLRQQFERAIAEVSAATAAVVTHPQFRERYPEFMTTLHQLIRATVPVMQTSLRRCRELADADPVAAAMVAYYEHHIQEEMHHDDKVLEDLEFLGVPRAEVLLRMQSLAEPPPAQKKQFRIEKVEERIAPRKPKGNSSATDTVGSASVY